MGNMAYCRFENTEADLQDCVAELTESDGNISHLSDSEQQAALRLLESCEEISGWGRAMRGSVAAAD